MSLILQITNMVADTMSTAAATPPVEKTLTLWELAVKGGPILIPIGILSILALYIFF